MKQKLRTFYRLLILIGFTALTVGCSAMKLYPPAEMPSLTADQETGLGEAVEERLIQILGGSYHDKELNRILDRFASTTQCHVIVVERSTVEMYPLPGRRAIMTRGLLTELHNLEQLEKVLARACHLSRTAYLDNSSSHAAKATAGFFAGGTSIYDPRAPDILLAENFAGSPCAESCLDDIFTSTTGTGRALPGPVEELKSLRPGYDLLLKARQVEKSGELRQAIVTYLKAATVTPDNARILSELGMAYLRAGDMQSAGLHLQKADSLYGNYYKTKMGLGYLSLHTGKIRQANSLLAESVQLLPVNENIFLLAEAREKSGDAAGAISLYRIVAEDDRYSKLGRIAANRLKLLKADQ